MKITWLAGRLQGWTTGRTMVSLLERWDLRTHPIRVVCWEMDACVADVCGRLAVDYEVFPASQSHNLYHRRRWWQELQATKADIWHCWSREEQWWVQAARWMGASHPPLHLSQVATWAGSSPRLSGGANSLQDLSACYASLLSSAMSRASHPDSNAGPAICPLPSADAVPSASSADAAQWRIATISRMERNCRLEHLIWSTALLRHNFPTVWLDICGDGPARARVVHFASCTGTDGLAVVADADKWSGVLNRARCLWLGNDEPGMEYLVFDALDHQIPVVAADSDWSRQFGEHNRLLHRVPAGRAGRADLARLTTRWLIESGAPRSDRSLAGAKSCG